MAEANKWQTNIIDPSINRIIALSDIHGDMHALIIAFRDCAQVIRKKAGHGYEPGKLDMETEILLELDLNTPAANMMYKDDLNYEWCGNNTNIVICGDIIDGFRDEPMYQTENRTTANKLSRCYPSNCTEHEYDQIEIKIFRFIN